MNTTVVNYLQKHYDELSRVAARCCRRAGIPAEAGDVLHEVLLVTLLDPGKQLDYAERVETDPELLLHYLKRIIKLNACSSRAPYRQERDRLEALLDRAAEINALPVADTVGEDRASRVWDVFDRLPLTPLERELFLFCYRDNLDFLEKRGGELVFFSPLHDPHFPEGVKGLVLYGGYPELWGSQLEANETLRRELREAVRGGLPCVAECGGFQYLQERLRTAEGNYAMAGVLEGESFPAGSRRFGYVELTGGRLFEESLAAPLRAHEFHYYDSSRCGEGFTARKPVSGRQWPCMISEKTLLAGYPHFHYRGNPQIGEAFLEACRRYAKEKG